MNKAQDYARERIRNFIEDHELNEFDFARRIERGPAKVQKFLDGSVFPVTALHKCAAVMGITYEKLISPLGPEDYE